MNTEELLLWHAKEYPQMQPRDFLKLLYQKNFGAEHLVSSVDVVLNRLIEELSGLEEKKEKLVPVGDDIVRYSLREMKQNKISAESLTDAFLYTAGHFIPDDKQMADDVSLLVNMTKKGDLPFSGSALNEELSSYGVPSWHAVSHSDIYRSVYCPAYRLLDKRVLRLLEVIEAVHRLLSEKENIVVVIDGRCASGKTTSAMILSSVFSSPVIHMDDFFLPPSMRTEDRRCEAGGNVHYERFCEEVLPYLKNHRSFDYRKFSCSACNYLPEKVHVPTARVRIVEGSYSMHMKFGDYGDVTCFSFIEPSEQMNRIVKRGDNPDNFVKKWIPLEESYFKVQRVRERADITLF